MRFPQLFYLPVSMIDVVCNRDMAMKLNNLLPKIISEVAQEKSSISHKECVRKKQGAKSFLFSFLRGNNELSSLFTAVYETLLPVCLWHGYSN